MKTYFLLAVVLFSSSFSFGSETETRLLESFNSIKISGTIDVVLKSGEPHLEIIGNPSDFKKVKSDIDNGILTISQTKDIGKTEVVIYANSLQKIDVKGASTLISKDTVVTDNLTVNVMGAGGVELIVSCNNLYTNVMGAGDMKISGKAVVHKAEVKGAGDVMAFDLETEVTKANIFGAGDIHIYAIEEVDAKVAGAGDIFVKGEPKRKNIDINGFGGSSYSYNDTITTDTTKLNFRNYRLWVITDDDNKKCDTCYSEPEENKHWAGLELGVAGYTAGNSLKIPAPYQFLDLDYSKSYSLNFNFLEKSMPIAGEHVKLATGLGISFNSYHFSNNISLQPNRVEITGVYDSINDFTKNKLNTTWVTVPLLLGFNTHTNPKKAFHISVGAVAGYKFRTKYKQKYNDGSKNQKNISRANYNMLPYSLGARASIGYGNFNIYANYSLTEMFYANEGPSVNPFSLGVRLIGF